MGLSRHRAGPSQARPRRARLDVGSRAETGGAVPKQSRDEDHAGSRFRGTSLSSAPRRRCQRFPRLSGS